MSLDFTGQGSCSKSEWLTHGSSRYCVNNTPTLKWDDGRAYCKNIGGELAVIRTANDNQFIFDLLKKQNTVTEWGVWLGLYRKADGMFYWTDDKPLMDTVEDPFEGQYLAWNTGEPNNHDGHENCVHMYAQGSLQGKWNDIRCIVNM